MEYYASAISEFSPDIICLQETNVYRIRDYQYPILIAVGVGEWHANH